ncbi:MAG: Holliday junction resolvase RuvX [Proteobacteria bacterium]|nr:Holliday junction resolvase RuvX [Pseudomonadota bacterium]
MALDVGTKTIGIAISDPLRMFPQPHSTLSREGVKKDIARLSPLVTQLEVDHLVVGLPLELDGEESRSARLARQIGEAMREATGLSLTYIDERYSSVEAERWLLEADLSRSRRKQVIDQAAAIVILRSYLDHGDWTQDAASDTENR